LPTRKPARPTPGLLLKPDKAQSLRAHASHAPNCLVPALPARNSTLRKTERHGSRRAS
jgi:hypothetical protein